MINMSVENFDILIVDDDIQFGRLVQRLLLQMNRAADVAHTGAEAISKAQKYSNLIVFLDVNLPDLPSLEIAETIHQQQHASVAVIGLSGHSRSDVRDFVDSPYVDFYEQKPMSLPDLKSILQSSLAQGAELLKVRASST